MWAWSALVLLIQQIFLILQRSPWYKESLLTSSSCPPFHTVVTVIFSSPSSFLDFSSTAFLDSADIHSRYLLLPAFSKHVLIPFSSLLNHEICILLWVSDVTTPCLCSRRWFLLKFKYWSVWVSFLNTLVWIVPSWLITDSTDRMSRKAKQHSTFLSVSSASISCHPCNISTYCVHLICDSIPGHFQHMAERFQG